MADPLIIDPALQAEVIRQFNLRGELSPFLLTNRVVPIFDIGRLVSVAPQEVVTPALVNSVRIGQATGTGHLAVAGPPNDVADIDSDRTVGAGAGVVLADSGQLSAGLHWIRAGISYNSGVQGFDLAWRNAADTATLKTIPFELEGDSGLLEVEFVANFALDERIVWKTFTAAAGSVSTYIMFPATALEVAV